MLCRMRSNGEPTTDDRISPLMARTVNRLGDEGRIRPDVLRVAGSVDAVKGWRTTVAVARPAKSTCHRERRRRREDGPVQERANPARTDCRL